MKRFMALLGVVALAVLGAGVLAACVPPPPPPPGPCGNGAAPPATYQHVVWIWMENHHLGDVIGNANAPYENQLANQCGTVGPDYSSVGAPSLPNYIGATAGATFGINDDNPPSSHPLDTDNLFRQVRAAGGSSASFEESMSSNCQLTSSGEYAVKHNPQPYYSNPADRAACATDNVPYSQFDPNNLPSFSFITPNLCNDTHDCSVATGDQWLSQNVPAILNGANYQAGDTAVFIVWDEPTFMPFIAVAPTVPSGTVVTAAANHFSTLRMTEEMLGLPLLGQANLALDQRPKFGL